MVSAFSVAVECKQANFIYVVLFRTEVYTNKKGGAGVEEKYMSGGGEEEDRKRPQLAQIKGLKTVA